MKKVLLTLCGFCSIILSSCTASMFGQYKVVETFDEIKKLTDDNEYIKLGCDIDCNYETLSNIKCARFDGDGYSLKNIVSTSKENYSLFSDNTEKIENLIIDNSTFKIENGLNDIAIISKRLDKKGVEINNVTIKNSKLDCSFTKNTSYQMYDMKVGGFIAGCDISGYYVTESEKTSSNVNNCTLDNVKFDITVEKSRSGDVYVGGLVGYGMETAVSQCKVVNSEFIVNGKTESNDIYIGGIAGKNTKIEDSFVKNTSISGINTTYSGSFGILSTPEIVVGGIAGDNNKLMSFCYSQDLTLTANSSGDAYSGGICGICRNGISQSYSRGNEIFIKGYVSNNSHVKRRTGGFVSSGVNATITSCFSYDNTILDQSTNNLKYSEDSLSGGFVGKNSNCSISKCASNSPSIAGGIVDSFVCENAGTLSENFIDDIRFGNVSNAETITSDFWTNSNEIKEKLHLLGGKWFYSLDDLPHLEF